MSIAVAMVSFLMASAQMVDGYNFEIDGFAAYAGKPGTAWYHEGGTTGGAGGEVVYANTFPQLQAYLQSSKPYIIFVDHDITTGIKCYVDDLSTGHLLDDQSGASGVETTYGERIMVASNKTLIGIVDPKTGKAPLFSRITFVMQCTHNVIIRNCRFTMVGVPILKTGENKIVAWRDGAQVEVGDPDCIGIQADKVSAKTDSGSHIWVDHCEFFNGGAANKDRYDGLLDCKNNVQWMTFSYNKFHNHDKSCLWGKGDSDVYTDCRTISAHHNMFIDIEGSRLPLQRGGNVHYMNNYQEGCSDGWDLRSKSVGYAEACYFKNSKAPILPDGGGSLTICPEKDYGIIYDNCQRVIKGAGNVEYVNAPSKYDEEFTYIEANWKPTDTYSGYSVNNRVKAADVPAFVQKYSGAGAIEIWKRYASAVPAVDMEEYKNATKSQTTASCYDENGNKVSGTSGGGTSGDGNTPGDVASKTLFNMQISSSASDVAITDGSKDIASSCSVLTGGTVKVGLRAAATSQKVVGSDSSQRHIRMPKNDVYLEIALAEPLAAGDVIKFTSNGDSTYEICFMATNQYDATNKTAGHSYTVTDSDGLAGATTIYVSRAQAKTTYVQSLSITRNDGTTAIEAVGANAVKHTGVKYTLSGVRVENPVKGTIYIMDGKKYVAE